VVVKQEKKVKQEKGHQHALAAVDNAEWKRMSRPLLDGGQGKIHKTATNLRGTEKPMTSVAAKHDQELKKEGVFTSA